jgi:hypothetical protein
MVVEANVMEMSPAYAVLTKNFWTVIQNRLQLIDRKGISLTDLDELFLDLYLLFVTARHRCRKKQLVARDWTSIPASICCIKETTGQQQQKQKRRKARGSS